MYRLRSIKQNSKYDVLNSTSSIKTMATACNVTDAYVGQTIGLAATPTGGIAPYTVEFKVDATVLNTVSNVAEGQIVTYAYPLTQSDVGTRVFSVNITDSCPTIPSTCSEQCTVNVLSCGTPTCNFAVTLI